MPNPIGQFEQLVLTAILSLRDDAYGITIHEKAERAGGAEKDFAGSGLCDAGPAGR